MKASRIYTFLIMCVLCLTNYAPAQCASLLVISPTTSQIIDSSEIETEEKRTDSTKAEELAKISDFLRTATIFGVLFFVLSYLEHFRQQNSSESDILRITLWLSTAVSYFTSLFMSISARNKARKYKSTPEGKRIFNRAKRNIIVLMIPLISLLFALLLVAVLLIWFFGGF